MRVTQQNCGRIRLHPQFCALEPGGRHTKIATTAGEIERMRHGSELPLDRCPHCSVARPVLNLQWQAQSANHASRNKRHWGVYRCNSCGSMVLAVSPETSDHEIYAIWPEIDAVSEDIPSRARDFLSQAIASLHAPAGAVMLTASAVDSMLKEQGLKAGSLNSRIDEAAKNHLITKEMAAWAHEIRLDANDQRHADDEAPLPSAADAEKAIDFAKALGQFLFVLPARVERGRKQ